MIRILHVDDNADDHELTKLNLLRLSSALRIAWAVNGVEALQQCEEADFDCILCDYQMPQMDGVEFLKHLRAREQKTPVIFLTGQGNEELAAEAFREQADDYFTKAVGFAHYDRLLNSIRRSVEVSRQNSLQKELEQKLRLAHFSLDQTAVASFWINEEGRFFYVNRAACENLGYSKSEIESLSVFDVDMEYTSEGWTESWRNIRERKQVVVESKQRRKDGSVFPVQITANYLEFEGKAYNCAFAIDISKRKALEEQLRTSEERVRTFLDSASDGFFLLDADLRLTDANKQAEYLTKTSREQLIGMKLTELVPDIELSGRLDVYEEVLRTGEPGVIDYFQSNPKFEVQAAMTRAFKVGDGLGLIVTDISALQEVQTALSRSEQRFQELTESLPQIVFEADLEGTLTYANRSAFEAFGYSQEDFEAGLNVFELISPEQREQAALNLQRVIEGQRLALREYTVRRKDCSTFPVLLDYNVILQEGKPSGFRGFVLDNSERKAAELELQRSRAQLEEANKELESFAHAVSHDLRAPLRHIKGYYRILADSARDKLNEEEWELLQRIDRASSGATELVDSLLELSRRSSGGLKLSRINLSELARDIAEKIRADYPLRDVRFSVEEGIEIVADSGLMQIVLYNLLENAWKFTAKRRNAEVAVGITERGGKTAVFVRDNGMGLAPEDREQLFTPFFRQRKTEQYEGTGIGLATVKRIIHRHGGSVWVESQEGEGAAFFFTVE